ncbi:hypothetical protein [Metaclostridioides mangenotii]|jgi:hypothetical protein|uniref:hypothetical protein n=1 Tax=Metaclostridioides mangenotii TaxID=1540 RepID=UPI000463C2E8|nr:hypothetical protein [Clostridioides mangenotii]
MNNKQRRVKKKNRKLYLETNKCPKCRKQGIRADIKNHKMCKDCYEYEKGLEFTITDEKLEELNKMLDMMNKGVKEVGLNN